MARSNLLALGLIVATVSMGASRAALAQAAKPAEAPPAPAKPETTKPEAAPSKDTPPPNDASKSLDELLGIPKSKPTAPDASGADKKANEKEGSADAAIATDKAHDRVEKALDEKAVEDLLRQALGSMRVSADRLSKDTDAGLGTQRVQQDAIAKLDSLIEEAKKRCKGGQCSGGGSCDKQGDKPCDKPGDKSGEAKPGDSKSRKPGDKAGPSAGATAAGAEPPQVDAVDNGKIFDETRAEWGALPQRVRDLIRQGSRDRIAAIYQRLTEEYYRRMAEDASK